MNVNTHPQIEAFMRRQGLDVQALRRDGRLVFTVDDRHRVHLERAAQGALVVHSRVMDLPTSPADRAVLIDRVLNRSAALLQGHGSTLSIDEREDALCLQQHIPADQQDAQTIDRVVGDFVNVLQYWKTIGIHA